VAFHARIGRAGRNSRDRDYVVGPAAFRRGGGGGGGSC
jgi:hypothetical protein